MNEKSCKNCRKHDGFTWVCFNSDGKTRRHSTDERTF
nr:MAG TPA: hypothetical protein [Inoviridae sp.]